MSHIPTDDTDKAFLREGAGERPIAEQLYGQINPVRPERLGLTQIELENSAAPFQAWLAKHEQPTY